MPDKSLLRTFVYHELKCFVVHTFERDSSAALKPGRYTTTLVWSWDITQGMEREFIAEASGGNTFDRHTEVCRQLYLNGEYVEAE